MSPQAHSAAEEGRRQIGQVSPGERDRGTSVTGVRRTGSRRTPGAHEGRGGRKFRVRARPPEPGVQVGEAFHQPTQVRLLVCGSCTFWKSCKNVLI